ncbi:MAG: hypothetical protein H6851_18565 [Geminicoccaceae bacterium]|nr:hypothetical protein [Geminicoccaceae bacterium]MCB9945611.1 hypothetical protein [Geminicoccaceae bacterium]
MNVINNVILLVRRIKDLQRRHEVLVERQDALRRTLPEWTFAPLQLVGMSTSEIQSAMSELTRAETDVGIGDLDRDIEDLERQIEELENALLTTKARSFDSVQAVLDLAIARFRSQTCSDPSDVFYDYGDARVLSFLERSADDLRALLSEGEREAV